MRRICTSTRKDGQPCRAPAVTEAGLCVSHAPELRQRLAEGQAKGGKAKANRERMAKNLPDDLRSLGAKLLDAFDNVYAGTMEPKTAAALSSLAGAYLRVYEVGVTDQKVSDLEAKLAAVEGPR